MLTVTFDTNCLIDVEGKRSGSGYDYQDVLKILELHKKQKIDLAVVAASASDIRINGAVVDNFSKFLTWLGQIGFKDVSILKPVGYWDITFFDYCLWSGKELEELDHKIHDILFPQFPYEDSQSRFGDNWRNAKLDVLMLWAHIWNKRDCFITRDGNFLRKAKELDSVGTKEILHPRDFLQYHVN